MSNDLTTIRNQILNSFLENLFFISDKEYQKRIWIEGKGPECYSFEDAVCNFFDLGEYIFQNHEGYGITDNQYHLLVQFRDEFKSFADENDWPHLFIDTLEWAKIISMAKEILEAFNYQKDLNQDAKNGTAPD